MKCWKIVERDGERIKTLFHGNDGSRSIPIGKWLRAEERVDVQDGNGTRYISGWHVFKSLEMAEYYLKRFRKERVIIQVQARKLRKKDHSRGEVFLARWLKVDYE